MANSMKKAELGHGEFMPWVAGREKLNQVEVNRCIKVFLEFPEVLSNSSRVTNLSKRDVLSVVYAPGEVKDEIKERLANVNAKTV